MHRIADVYKATGFLTVSQKEKGIVKTVTSIYPGHMLKQQTMHCGTMSMLSVIIKKKRLRQIT